MTWTRFEEVEGLEIDHTVPFVCIGPLINFYVLNGLTTEVIISEFPFIGT